MSDEHIHLTLQGANRASKETGIDIMTILRQGFRETPQRLYIVENDDLKTAFRMAAENTKCIREQYNYNPKEESMRIVTPESDESMTMTDNQSM